MITTTPSEALNVTATSEEPAGWSPAVRFSIQIHNLPHHTLRAEGVKAIDMGTLEVTSGRILAIDATRSRVEPLVQIAPKVSAQVTAYMEDDCIGSVAIEFDPFRLAPERWRLAERCGGYERFHWVIPIDSGWAVIADAYNHPRIREWMHANLSDVARCSCARKFLDLSEELGFSAFLVATGYGDGLYPSFWGYDSDGEVQKLILDFGMWPS